MTTFYFYLVLVNAAAAYASACAVWWKNRFQPVGPLLGFALFITAVWLVGFAQYFRPMDTTAALRWAHLTLGAAILSTPFLAHGMCALVEKMQRMRWWLVSSHVMGFVFLILLVHGDLIHGVKASPFMHHYIEYRRSLYPALGLYLVLWQAWGAGLLVISARQAEGYKRTQLVYFAAAWFIVCLTSHSIIMPLEYNINIQPFGFFILPINFIFLAYVMGKARLADYNIVIARVFMYAITMLVVVGVCLLFVGGVALMSPGFMTQQQIFFSVIMSATIGLGLTLGLPRLLPRAERIMQERLFGSRAGYQEALSGLVRKLGTLPNIDQLLATVATTVHSQMQLTRVIILMEESLSGEYRLRAESGAGAEPPETFTLAQDSPLLRWLRTHPTLFVRDEVARQVPERVMRELIPDLDRLGIVVAAPTIVDDKVTGILALGGKTNRDMFYISDLNLIGNLATELALVVKYRRVEEEIFHKNKLIELGTIAAGVAHEIRNPVTSITTLAQLLPERMDEPEFRTEFSKRVIEDVERIKKVIDNMLSFARPTEFTLQPHSLDELVDDSIMLTRPKLKSKNVELTKQTHEAPLVNVDKPKIQQVLINLISNAVDAMAEKGKIRIATGVRMMEDTGNGNHQRRFAVIEVADNGSGIPTNVRTRLFDPFFTTKKDGTGLGLSISQKIVRDHGGIITVSSVEGKGTTFQVNLPIN